MKGSPPMIVLVGSPPVCVSIDEKNRVILMMGTSWPFNPDCVPPIIGGITRIIKPHSRPEGLHNLGLINMNDFRFILIQ